MSLMIAPIAPKAKPLGIGGRAQRSLDNHDGKRGLGGPLRLATKERLPRYLSSPTETFARRRWWLRDRALSVLMRRAGMNDSTYATVAIALGALFVFSLTAALLT
jgi:hypothetical protein